MNLLTLNVEETLIKYDHLYEFTETGLEIKYKGGTFGLERGLWPESEYRKTCARVLYCLFDLGLSLENTEIINAWQEDAMLIDLIGAERPKNDG